MSGWCRFLPRLRRRPRGALGSLAGAFSLLAAISPGMAGDGVSAFTGPIVSHLSAQCIDYSVAENQSWRAPVAIAACNDQTTQQWHYEPGTSRLIAIGSGANLCLEADPRDATLVLRNCDGNAAQYWRFTSDRIVNGTDQCVMLQPGQESRPRLSATPPLSVRPATSPLSLGSCTAAGAAWTIVNGSYAGEGMDSPYVPSGYVKVFADEFDGAALDTTKWWTRYIYGGPDGPGTLDFLNDEQQRYRENGNHAMTGHSLQLTAALTDPNPADWVCCESGMIRSKTTFRGGYFEARVKLPPGKGSWGGFWLNSSARPGDGNISWPPEIDIFEFVVNFDSITQYGGEKPNMIHSNGVTDGPQDDSILYADPGFDPDFYFIAEPYNFGDPWLSPTGRQMDGYHVFGLLWDEVNNTISTYIDGALIVQRQYNWLYDDATPAPYAHVLLNLAIGGSWAGANGIDTGAFPKVLEADYVRVYQPSDRQQLGVDTVGLDLCPASGNC